VFSENANVNLAAVAEAIEYQTVVFQVSGGGTREHPITPYEGPPTPEKDMRWYELMDGNSDHTKKSPRETNDWKLE
jgi:hypothetical protein